MSKPKAGGAAAAPPPPALLPEQVVGVWATAQSQSAESLLSLTQTLAALAGEVAVTRAQALAEGRSHTEIITRLLTQEAAARELAAAAVARAEAAEAALALAPAEQMEAVLAVRREDAAEMDALRLALKEKTVEVERLHDAKLEKADSDRRIAELEAEVAATRESHRSAELLMERRNAADRESLRVLMLDHVKEMKRGLLERTAESMGDNMKRMVAEHEQLLMELAFSSKRGEEVALLNQRLVLVRGTGGWPPGAWAVAVGKPSPHPLHTHTHLALTPPHLPPLCRPITRAPMSWRRSRGSWRPCMPTVGACAWR